MAINETLKAHVESGLQALADHEKLLRIKKNAGESIQADKDRVNPNRAKLLKWADALEKEGVTIDYKGVVR